MTQDQLARLVGVSRSCISAIECGRKDPTLSLVDRISGALGLEIDIAARPPVIIGRRQKDFVHARCSAYVQRRMEAAGLVCLRETEIADGRLHGWIDLLAFDPGTGVLYVIEIKTVLDDLGGAERQVGWYVRLAPRLARTRGWQVRRVGGWLLVLATDEVDRLILDNGAALRLAFPTRAVAMRADMAGDRAAGLGWGLALIDPSSRRRAWLQPSRLDGRRTAAPYRDYADAAARWRLAGQSRPRPVGEPKLGPRPDGEPKLGPRHGATAPGSRSG